MSRLDTELTTSSFMDMSMMVWTVNEAVERFSKGGWVNHADWPSRWKELHAYLDVSKARFHEAIIDGVKVLAGGAAGRILVTFSKKYANGTAQVTVIGSEDKPVRDCGLQSITATPGEVEDMIHRVIVGWDMSLFEMSPHARIC